MGAEFKIVIDSTGGGGAGPGGSGSQSPTQRIAHALDPRTGRPLTERYLQSYEYRALEAKQGGFLSQMKFNFGEMLSGGQGATAAVGGIQKQLGLLSLGQLGGPLGAIGRVAGGIAGAGAAFGPVGMALAAATESMKMAFGIASAAVHKFTETVDYFVQRGEIIGKYSGAISIARAQSKVRTLLADIREASVLGGDIGRLTDAQSRVQNEIREILLPIKAFVVNKLAVVMELLAKGIETAGPVFIGIMKSLLEPIDVALAALGELPVIGEKIQEALAKKPMPDDELMFGLLGALGGFDAPQWGEIDHQQKIAVQQQNVPALREKAGGVQAGIARGIFGGVAGAFGF